MVQEIMLPGLDGYQLSVKIWDDVSSPKGVVQLFHGMAEHIKRYEHLAEFLNSKGLIVIGHDHRGHGDSKKDRKPLGYIGENGFRSVVEEGHMVTKYIKSNYHDLKIFLFAHSFGSFVAQSYICKYGDSIDGLILSGSAKKQGMDIHLGYGLGKLQRMLSNDMKPGKLLDKLSFTTFNKKIKPRRTQFDWLSTDEKAVDKYIDDPLSGYLAPLNFFVELSLGLINLYKKETLLSVPKSLPIFIVSGNDDPVGNYGKSLLALEEMYKSISISNVTLKLYDGCRHELINEKIYKDVFKDINEWIDNNI